MEKHLYLLLILGFLLTGSNLDGQTPALNTEESVELHPNQYFVKLCHGISNKEVQALMSELNSVELWKNEKIGLRLWSVKKFPYSCSDGEISDIDEHVARSRSKTSIDDVLLNMIFKLEESDYNGEDSYFDQLDLRGEVGTTPIKIAILDSGISDEAIQTNSDYSGPVFYSGYDYVDNDPVPNDENGHGTLIAGIIYDILSREGNPASISFDIRKTHDENGLGDISNLISAIVDAVDAGANIINMSFSYYDFINSEELNPLQLAIDYAEQNGVLVVASAGNNYHDNDAPGAVPLPACLPNENIISVASNRWDESLSPFSNFGAQTVDISVLGESIPGPGLSGSKKYASGTSFSTAIISAVSAILGSRQDKFNGCAIKCILISTSKKVPGMESMNQAGGDSAL